MILAGQACTTNFLIPDSCKDSNPTKGEERDFCYVEMKSKTMDRKKLLVLNVMFSFYKEVDYWQVV